MPGPSPVRACGPWTSGPGPGELQHLVVAVPDDAAGGRALPVAEQAAQRHMVVLGEREIDVAGGAAALTVPVVVRPVSVDREFRDGGVPVGDPVLDDEVLT